MDYRRACKDSDYQQIEVLQNQNLLSQLTPEEAKAGFLLRAFSADDFRRMNADLCVMLAWDQQERLAGYLCANVLTEDSPFEFVRALYQQAKTVQYHGKRLTQYQVFIASPLCIDRPYRGTSLFFQLASAMLNSPQITSDYDLILTFVSVDNERSLNACRGLSFEPLEIFSIGSLRYWLLVDEINLKERRELSITPHFSRFCRGE